MRCIGLFYQVFIKIVLIQFRSIYTSVVPLGYYFLQKRPQRKVADWMLPNESQADVHFDQLRKQLKYSD